MTKSNPKDESVDNEQQEIEEKVRKMLDPSEPDEVADKPSFKIIKPTDEEPGTAPEIEDTPTKLPVSIEIKSHDDEPEDKDDSFTGVDDAVAEPSESTDDKTEAKESEAEEPEVADTEDKPSKAISVRDESAEATNVETKLADPVEAPKDVAEEPEEDSHEPDEDKAVDDIIAAESDDILEAEDEKIAKAFEDKKPSFGEKLRNFFSAWWQNTIARRLTIGGIFIGLVAVFTIPVSRYFLLNSFGIRSSASVIVLDESTLQPLRNVEVKIRQESALTDDSGRAVLHNLKLGQTQLMIEKRAFATSNEKVTIGWGSNPLGDKNLTPVGSQYSFVVSDFLSKKPIQKIEAVSGYASAFSDEAGLIKLTLDDVDNEFEVKLVGADLREEVMTISATDNGEHKVEMVPSRKHVFVSKRSGRYDVYKVDADGKNEELVLAGTGNERDDLVLLPHPSNETVALVSTRDNVRNQDGYLLSTLNVINLSDNSSNKVAQSERIILIGWVGDRLVFVRVAAGSSAANPKRHRLISYNFQTNESTELATSNYFNDVVVANESIYYAPSSAYTTDPVALFKPNADGSDRKSILDQEVWNIFRTDYDKLTLATGKDWYEYNLVDFQTAKLSGQPSDLDSRIYVDSPDKTKSLWVDERDGKGVLIIYDVATRTDSEVPLYSRSGLKNPVRWLNNNSVVFRVATDQETADYAISLNGGEPAKIRDVTNTNNTENWYYY